MKHKARPVLHMQWGDNSKSQEVAVVTSIIAQLNDHLGKQQSFSKKPGGWCLDASG